MECIKLIFRHSKYVSKIPCSMLVTEDYDTAPDALAGLQRAVQDQRKDSWCISVMRIPECYFITTHPKDAFFKTHRLDNVSESFSRNDLDAMREAFDYASTERRRIVIIVNGSENSYTISTEVTLL